MQFPFPGVRKVNVMKQKLKKKKSSNAIVQEYLQRNQIELTVKQ